jgi:hypothetical protein
MSVEKGHLDSFKHKCYEDLCQKLYILVFPCTLTVFVIYVPQNEDTEQQIIRETFHLVSKRDENVCNFLEGGM